MMRTDTNDGDPVGFDPLTAVLRIDQAGLDELTRLVSTGSGEAHDPDGRWHAGGIVVDGRIVPAVRAMVSVNAAAVRAVVIERVSGGLADQMLVGWDAEGRAVISHRTGENRVTMQASSFEILPVLVSHHLRLLRALEPSDGAREAVQASTEAVNSLLSGGTPPADDQLGDSIGPVRLAWRVSAGWTGRQPDTSLIGLSTDSGHWLVETGSSTTPTTVIRLRPAGVAEAVKRVGVVVSGRRTGPPAEPQPSPSTSS